MTDDAENLQEEIRRLIAAAEPMGMTVRDVSEDGLTICAPLDHNYNHSGYGFAGSIYSVCCLAGWLVLRHWLRGRGETPELLLGEGRIRYNRPVTADFNASVQLHAEQRAHILERLAEGRSARVTLEIDVADDRPNAARFTGTFFALRRAP